MAGPDDSLQGIEDLFRSEDRFRLLVESVRDYAIFMLDPQGIVRSWNAGAQRFMGYTRQEIVGQHFSRFYPPEELPRGGPQREIATAADHGVFEEEGWRVRQDGSRFWANVVLTAMRDEQGHLIGYAKVTRDLSERREYEESLRRSEERFRLMVEGVPDYAIFMLDADGRVASWNIGAQRIKGYAANEVMGHHVALFHTPEARASGWPEHELQMATAHGSFVDEGWRVRKDGSRLWAHVTITALRDGSGQLLGFAKLTRDLTERGRAEAAVAASAQREAALQAEREARLAAQRAIQMKDEFLATLSHELRTPLSAILGWTQVLVRAGAQARPQDLQRAIEVIDRNARAQVQLIDDLLDMSKIISGKVRLDLRPVSLVDVVQAAMDTALPGAQAKEIRLHAVLDPRPASIAADAGRLQQVVWNLLTNAIKFTPKGGKIQVLLQRVNSHIELSVSDTGIGIPPDFLPQVFDRFAQLDSSTTRAHGGLGLGLAISKQLVELHGGSLRATSPGVGHGSTFFVELPLSLAQLEPGQAREHPTAGPVEGEALLLPCLAGLRVWVVDDEVDARELLRRVFEVQGATVVAFESAESAMAELAQPDSARPAAIVSDIGMPRMDGYEFMRLLRASEAHEPRIPALALTAFARPDDRKRALLSGYQAHLAKPFDVGELVLLVADLVRR